MQVEEDDIRLQEFSGIGYRGTVPRIEERMYLLAVIEWLTESSSSGVFDADRSRKSSSNFSVDFVTDCQFVRE